jgi:two-component system OmpR family response regulator
MSADSRREAQARPKLLIVEDDPNIVELLSASLRFAGFDVTAVTNGNDAVAAAKEIRPDLVVLDVMLPDLDGFEVIRRMRDGGVRSPVVFLTARDATDDKIRGLTLGGDDYVTKPFSLEELTARIRAVLRRSSGELDDRSKLTSPTSSWTRRRTRYAGAARRCRCHPPSSSCFAISCSTPGGCCRSADPRPRVAVRLPRRRQHRRVHISYLRRKVDSVEPRLIHT